MNDQDVPFSKPELMKRLAEGWNSFHQYLKTLSEEQITTPTDAAGWTVKDHVMHLAVWENGMVALLNHQPRHEAMGVDRPTLESDDYDITNDIIFKQHRDKSWAEVQQTFEDIHRKMLETLHALTEEDLTRPYQHYDPDSSADHPVWHSIVGNTFGHYAEHRPWIEAIV